MKLYSKWLGTLLLVFWPLLGMAGEGDVPYLAGGVGDEEMAVMQARKAEFNLRLLFAEKGSGSYVAGVKLRLDDKSGKAVLALEATGPVVLVKLPAGSYRASAEANGQALVKAFTVQSGRRTELNFYLPAEAVAPKP